MRSAAAASHFENNDKKKRTRAVTIQLPTRYASSSPNVDGAFKFSQLGLLSESTACPCTGTSVPGSASTFALFAAFWSAATGLDLSDAGGNAVPRGAAV